MKTKRWLLALALVTCWLGMTVRSIPNPQKISPQIVRPEDFLSGQAYKTVEIEVLHLPNAKPNPEALNFLVKQIQKYCYKTVTSVHQTEILLTPTTFSIVEIPTLIGVWNTSSIQMFEQRWGRLKPHDDVLVLRVLYISGILAEDHKAVGVAYAPYSFAIFVNRIQPNWEKEILLHEFGHICGLVDGHRQDPTHPWHCVNQRCIMFWCVTENPEMEFDLNCRRDLEKRGGRRVKKFY